MRPLSRSLLLSLLLVSAVFAGDQDSSVPVVPQTNLAPVAPVAALVLPQNPAPAAASLPALAPAAVLSTPLTPLQAPAEAAAQTPARNASGKRLIDTLAAPQPELGRMGQAESAQAAEHDFEERAQLGGSSAVPAQDARSIVEAYQDGRLGELGASPKLQGELEQVARRAVRRTLENARFRTKIVYGLLGTKVYESDDLPGIVLKTYFSPFGRRSKSWRGYSLAKERLGGLFADTTLVEGPITVTIDGKLKKLGWALAQELINTKDVKNWGARAQKIVDAMELRGVRDKDIGPRPGFHPVEFTRNLGETADGRFVHFDADFFVPLPRAQEGPKRVRDPPPLRGAIKQAQLEYLAGVSGN